MVLVGAAPSGMTPSPCSLETPGTDGDVPPTASGLAASSRWAKNPRPTRTANARATARALTGCPRPDTLSSAPSVPLSGVGSGLRWRARVRTFGLVSGGLVWAGRGIRYPRKWYCEGRSRDLPLRSAPCLGDPSTWRCACRYQRTSWTCCFPSPRILLACAATTRREVHLDHVDGVHMVKMASPAREPTDAESMLTTAPTRPDGATAPPDRAVRSIASKVSNMTDILT